jgi:hypothetical protein
VNEVYCRRVAEEVEGRSWLYVLLSRWLLAALVRVAILH